MTTESDDPTPVPNDAFKVRVQCENCGAPSTDTHKYGTRVKQQRYLVKVKKNRYIDGLEEVEETKECDVCGCSMIEIKSRWPIDQSE